MNTKLAIRGEFSQRDRAVVHHGRRGAGAEVEKKYVAVTRDKIQQELDGTLKTRPMYRPVYDPAAAGNSLTKSPWQS